MKNNLELLSPAGSYESLMAAIHAGCNSIYFGIEQLNMRARSNINFTIEDLGKISKICKDNQIKSYLTLNTVVFDHDISLMKRIVDAAKENGINAIIATDLSVLNYAKKVQMNVHISTQSNVTNIDTVEFFSVYSDVMVLARELSLTQVGEITNEIKRRNITGPSGHLVKIEIFGHGALCMAVSGKCYLSLHSNYASANRGACIQNCRKSYVVIDKEDGVELEIDNEYIMSAKDLCTIDFMDQIIHSGVAVLKIEGRGRSADYVSTVTKCYREAIDSCYNHSFTNEKIVEWRNQLATVYNRGFWDGYYLGKTMGEWSNEYGSKATKRKVMIGKGIRYYKLAKAAEFQLETQTLSVGDEILITGPTTGVVQTFVKEIRLDNIKTNKVKKGDSFTIQLDELIRSADKLFKLVPTND